MKFRTGFVTNSSSSSYVCEICGDCEGGYDMGLSDAGMIECEKGHTFCSCHIFKSKKVLTYIINSKRYDENITLKAMTAISLGDKEVSKFINEFIEFVDFDEDGEQCPSAFCPICNMDHIKESDIITHLKEKFNFNEDEIRDEIRNKYNNVRY